MLNGRALEDSATHPRRGWRRHGERAEDVDRVGQLAAAGGTGFQMPGHPPQARLVQLAEDEVRQLGDDAQVIFRVVSRIVSSCPDSRRSPIRAIPTIPF